MNIRWLFGNFTDPQHKLPMRKQFALSSLAHQRYVTRGVFLRTSALIAAPLVILLIAMDPLLSRLGYGGRNGPFLIAAGALIALFWPWSAWMYRSMYIRPIRQVMRDAGYDLCLACGYDLRGLNGDIKRCPECGGPREPAPSPSEETHA